MVSVRVGFRLGFDPPLFLRLLKSHAVSILHAAPPIIGFLAKHPSVDAVLPLPQLPNPSPIPNPNPKRTAA